MKLTLANLAEAVFQELGRDPGRSTMEALINEAGEAWVNLAEWFYLKERSSEIQLVAGTETYQLSPGVQDLHRELYRPDVYYQPIQIVDHETYLAEKDRYLSANFRLYNPLAGVWWDTKEGDDRPRLYLNIYPTDLGERVTYRYRAGWLPLDEQDDVADIPAPLVQPFVEWVRRYAVARGVDGVGMDQMVAQFMAGPTGVMAKRADARHRGQPIAARGGAGERYARLRAKRNVISSGSYGPFSRLEYLSYR